MDNHFHTLGINMEKEVDTDCVPTKKLDPKALNMGAVEMEKEAVYHPSSGGPVLLHVAS